MADSFKQIVEAIVGKASSDNSGRQFGVSGFFPERSVHCEWYDKSRHVELHLEGPNPSPAIRSLAEFLKNNLPSDDKAETVDRHSFSYFSYILKGPAIEASDAMGNAFRALLDLVTPVVNEYINSLRAKLYSQEVEMIKNGMEITIDTFVDVYKNGFKANTITLLQLFREHNKQFEKKISNGVNTSTTLDKYVVTMEYLASFLKTLKKDDIMIKDITPMFVEEFFVYLLKSMSNNTAIQKMKRLKKILRIAVEEGYIKVSPFKMTLREEQKEVQPLTIEEVRRIRAKKIDVDRMAKVRDLFVFECYTGLAFTDLVNLTSDNIITDAQGNEWIVKSRQKTKIQSTIPLLPIAKEILLKSGYKLPTLSNQKYNGYLKELGDICGINKDIHSHLARHTFATILLNSGVDMVSVSKILGHANSRITEKVYAKMLPDTIMSKVKGVQDKLL